MRLFITILIANIVIVSSSRANPVVTILPESSATLPADTSFIGLTSSSDDPTSLFFETGQSVFFVGWDQPGGSTEMLGDSHLIYRARLEFESNVALDTISFTGAGDHTGDSVFRLLDENMGLIASTSLEGFNSLGTHTINTGGIVGSVFFIDEFDRSTTWRYRNLYALNTTSGTPWRGDQATCDGSQSPPVGSFFDAVMWEGNVIPNGRVVFEAIDSGDDVNPSTVLSQPHRIHFGDVDVAPQALCINHNAEPGGDATVSALEIRNADWTFDFGPFDNYVGIGDFPATESGSLTVTGIAQILGTLAIQNGTMTAEEVRIEGRLHLDSTAVLVSDVLIADGGRLTGRGNVEGDVMSLGGTLSPGSSPGALAIGGNLVLGPNSTLELEIAGNEPGTEYDQLSVNGEASIQGKVEITFTNGFAPKAGDVFSIVNVDEFFSIADVTVETLNLAPGFEFTTNLVGAGFQLTALNDGVFVGEPGDFDSNGALGIGDLDLLLTEIRDVTDNTDFDLNDDGFVNELDRDIWVHELRRTYFGDANLDGTFDSADLVGVFQIGEYEDNVALNSTWATGDWNGNGDFESDDLVFAFADGGYERGPRDAASAVPEPASSVMLLVGLVGIAIRRQHDSTTRRKAV